MENKTYLNFLLANKLRPLFGKNTPTQNIKSLKDNTHLKPIIKKLNSEDKLMFLFVVSSDGLPGEVIKEVQSNLYEIILYESTGHPERSCDYCNGDGYINCDYCDGNGEQECSECDGSGDVTCETCDGSGQNDEEGPCDDCQGSGEVKCSNCEGHGKIGCDECGGDGSHTCYDCGGSGDVTDESEITLEKHYIYTYDPKVVSLFTDESKKSDKQFTPVFENDPMLLKKLSEQNKKTLVIKNYESDEFDSSLFDNSDTDDEYFIDEIINLVGKNLDDLPGLD